MPCYRAAIHYTYIMPEKFIASTDSSGLKGTDITPLCSCNKYGRGCQKQIQMNWQFQEISKFLISSGSMSAAPGLGLQSTKSWSRWLGQSQCQGRAVSVYFSSVPTYEPFWLWSLRETVELLCKSSEPCQAGTEAELITLAKWSWLYVLRCLYIWLYNTFGSGNVIKLSFIWMVMDGFILCSWLITRSLYSTPPYNRSSWVVKDKGCLLSPTVAMIKLAVLSHSWLPALLLSGPFLFSFSPWSLFFGH